MDTVRPHLTGHGRQLGLLVAFAILYVAFISTPALADAPFPARRDLRWGEIVDLATPAVILSLVWLIVYGAAHVSGRVLVALVVISIFWAQGQGMHLAANAINHQMDERTAPALAGVTEFLDETLSHYIWHVGILAIPALFLALAWRRSNRTTASWRAVAMTAGGVWGAMMGLDVIESVVVPLALPVFVLLAAGAVIGLIRAAPRPSPHPVYDFAAAGCIVAVLILIGWGGYHGGWPELSDVGLI